MLSADSPSRVRLSLRAFRRSSPRRLSLSVAESGFLVNERMTPPCASDAPDYADRTLDLFFANLRRYLAGRRLQNEVDRALQY